MTQKNFKKLFTIYFIIFGAIISIIGGVISYNMQLNSLEDDLNTKANEIMIIKKFTILKNKMEDIDNIVKSIVKNPTMKSYLQTKNERNLGELENVFFAVASVDTKIMQLRYINKDGMEIVRVDRTNEQDEPFLVSKEELQNKSKRDYFQIISSMQKNNIWHSKIDLNIENGKIEVPYRPTIRVGLPIFNKQNEFEGMVIVNILTNNLFNSISRSSAFDHFIVDKNGNYIIHPDMKYSFNKYTNTLRSLAVDFPQDASSILNKNHTCKSCYVYALNDVLNNEDKAFLILKPKERYKDELLKNRLQATLYIVFISMFASLFMAFYASIQPSKLQKALLKANDKLIIFTSILDKYVVSATTGKDSVILEVSSAFSTSSGYTKGELIGQPMSIIYHPDTPKAYLTNLWKTILSNKEWHGEIKNRKKDGSEFWLEQNIISVQNDEGAIESFISVGEDITTKKELEALSSIDKLTGILNRRKLDESLEHEVEVAKRHSTNLALIIVDIDHFKNVNDTYGHQLGDLVLSEVSNIITQAIRKSDIFGRFGGEEFLIICPQTTQEEAFVLAEKLRMSIANYIFEEIGHITISLGISQFANDEETEHLIKNADIALYEAKNSGRNKSVIHSPTLSAS